MMAGQAGDRPAADRENGNRNLRMLPAGCLAWAIALLVPWLLDRIMGGSVAGSAKSGGWSKTAGESRGGIAGGGTGMSVWLMPLVLALPLLIAMVLLAFKLVCLVAAENSDRKGQVLRHPSRSCPRNRLPQGCESPCIPTVPTLASTWFGPRKLPTLAVLAAVALTAALAAAVGHESARSGPAARQIRQGKALAEIRGRAVGPMSASSRRGWDCQAEIRLQWVTVAGVRMPSDERIMLFARSRSCLLQQGGQYLARGLLEPPAYGRPIPWLAVEDGTKQVEPPGPCRRLIARMQRAFLEQTGRLDDQGRILVPGLTMGILGNQALPGSDGSLGRPAVEPAYATRLTQDFRASGILHLMAVSGGHFMILASLLVRIMRALRSPPLLMALVLSAAYLGLGMLMVPGDSVLRAQAMGLLSALALAACRPAQSLNTLSWCVLLVLILRPSMAASFGFALSCGAVLGIGLGNRRLSALLEDHMPAFLARPLATTMCAQAGTLPVQVLMSPGLPLLAPLANLLVTPVVDAATVTGLLALLSSWLWPPVGLLLARLTSLGTGVMAFAATWLGEAAAPAAWPPGPVGSACLIGLGLMALIDHRLMRCIRARGRDHSWPAVTGANSGVPFRPSAWLSAKGWLRQTYGLLAQLVFKNDPG